MKLTTIFLLFILLANPSLATLGISHEPLVDRELELPRGENYLFQLTYQNTEDESVRVNITVESDIAELVGPSLATIPAESVNRYSLINISVPANSEVGDRYQIRYTISPATAESGQVPLSFRYDRSITVIVGIGEPVNAGISLEGLVNEKEESGWINIALTVLLLVAILAVGYFVWRKSKHLSEKTTKTPMVQATKALMIKTVQAKHPFIFADGTKINTLKELKNNITKKPEMAKKHIRDGKNDFSEWIEHELKNKELALKVREKSTVNDILKNLK